MEEIKASPYQRLTIREVKEEVPGVKSIAFDETSLSYQPGQYLTLVQFVHGEEVRRSYSFTSAPVLKEPLSICIKRVANGVLSRPLVDAAAAGDVWLTSGVGGFFVLPEHPEAYQQIFFLAAGVGITPIFSLLKTVLFAHPHLSVVLIYSNRSQATTIFYKELKQLEENFSQRLKTIFIESTNKNLLRAHLHKELLLAYVKEHSSVPFHQSLFYICGPEAYMRMCTYTLQEAHVPKDNIRKENFNTHRAIPPIAPPDKELHEVTLLHKGATSIFSAQYPSTILKSAKMSGLVLPYSCEVGRCGNCAALCQKGKVWMSNNEVLTDDELKKGWVLTCTAYPVGGDVTLEIP